MHLIYVSIVQLSNYKVFIGHSKSNTMIQSSWLVFMFRGNISILNLYHTIKMLKISYTLIRHIINKGFPLWLINFDLTKEDIIKYNAYRCGEFYLTRRWIRGLISNYYVITKAYRNYLIKKDFVDSNKVKDIYDKWLFTRFTWPRAVFISNVKSSYIVSKETASVGVPSIALVDSNEKTFLYTIPIGSNDDSLETIGFMHNIITQYVIQCKYKKVLIWYFFNRNIKRYQSLLEWLKMFIKIKKKSKYKRKLKNLIIPNYINHYADAKRGLNFFFGRSYNYKLAKKKNLEFNFNINFDSFYDLNKYILYNRLKVLNYRNLLYKYRIRFRRSKYLNKIESVGTFKSFLNNFIKLSGFSSRFRRIKIKKRIKMERRKISNSFRPFFHFMFFFFLNKFNIVIDSYNKKKYSLFNLIKISKKHKKKRNLHKNVSKYKFSYIFIYKSKKIYRKKKKKYGYIYESFNNISIPKNSMSFLFFHWKYLIMFLGLKLNKKYIK